MTKSMAELLKQQRKHQSPSSGGGGRPSPAVDFRKSLDLTQNKHSMKATVTNNAKSPRQIFVKPASPNVTLDLAE